MFQKRKLRPEVKPLVQDTQLESKAMQSDSHTTFCSFLGWQNSRQLG